MVGHEPRVPGVEGGGAAGGLDSEAGSEDSQEQEPGQEHGHGQHGAGHCWVLSSVSPFSISFRKLPVYECRLDNLENENDDKMSK